MPMRKVFSAAKVLAQASRLKARPVMRGNFFMFVLSRVVVGLAKKSSYKRQADSCKTEAFLYLEIHTGL
jgi:hypothetical protein